MTPSFHTRLLRLCELTYSVPRGPCTIPDTAPQAIREIGLIGSAQAIGRNPTYTGVRDLALVGHLPEGIVIAVRGTQPPRLAGLADAIAIGLDWSNDGLVLGIESDALGGIVHQGFASAANSLWRDLPDEGIINRVKAMVGANADTTRIILTGHSKGGPVAQLVAFMLRRETALAGVTIEVVTFAAARPGNAAFATLFAASGIDCLRYESHYDIVPQLPLGGPPDATLGSVLSALGISSTSGILGFAALGMRVAESVAEADAWTGPATSFPFNLATLLAGTPLGHAYRAIAAHAISPGSHYDRLLASHSVA